MATQVLILAAGRGSRLGSKTEDIPKPLLQIGSKFLVEHQLATFADAGVGPVAMVVGYRADEIREVVGIRAEYLHNPRWATSNSLYSFLLARDWVEQDLLIVNCDVLFHPKILDRLLSFGGDCFAYDSRSGNGYEHMKVRLENECLVEMGKELSHERSHGENVGLLYFRAKSVPLLFEEAERRLENNGPNDWLGAAVKQLAQRVPIRGIDIAPLPWAEIDFAYDLDQARKRVWPAIRERQPSVRRRTLAMAIAGLTLAASMQVAFYAHSQSLVQTPDWETIALADESVVELISPRGKRQSWWHVGSGRQIETDIVGPDSIRLESRLVMPSMETKERPYILGVFLDGTITRWVTCTAIPSRSAYWTGGVVAKRRREVVEIPAGFHRLRIELRSIEGEACLIRLRQADRAGDDEI